MIPSRSQENSPVARQTTRIPPQSRLWGAALVSVSLLVIAGVESRPIQHPGHSLVLLGFVIATALIRYNRSTRVERVAWAIIAVGLIGAEVHEARARRKEEQTFLYCQINRDGTVRIERHGNAKLLDVTMRAVDHYDLHALHVRRSEDGSEYQDVYQTVRLGTFPAEGAETKTLRPMQIHGDVIRYRISFSASNGLWWEDMQMRRVNGRWFQAYRIRRYHGSTPRTLMEVTDPGFPGGTHGLDWDWTSESL